MHGHMVFGLGITVGPVVQIPKHQDYYALCLLRHTDSLVDCHRYHQHEMIDHDHHQHSGFVFEEDHNMAQGKDVRKEIGVNF